jgi:hypothetical protein
MSISLSQTKKSLKFTVSPLLSDMLALPALARTPSSNHVTLRVSDTALARNGAFMSILAEAKGGLYNSQASMQRSASESHASSSSALGRTQGARVRKVAEGLGRNEPVPRTHRREVDPVQKEVMQEELMTKRRVLKLRKELGHSRSTAAMLQILSNKRVMGAEVRKETQRLQGAHLSDSVRHVEPADEAEVSRVATLLVQRLTHTQPDPSKRNWFTLFKDFDENGDGHITFDELVLMIRHKIKCPRKLLPDEIIQKVLAPLRLCMCSHSCALTAPRNASPSPLLRSGGRWT